MRKKFLKTVPKIIITIIFFSTVVLSLLFAEGFRFDPENRQFIKTGIMDISSLPVSALYIEDEYKGATPLFLRDMPLKSLEIRLEKQGYQKWQKKITIDSEKVIRIKNIILLPNNIENKIKTLPENMVLFDKYNRGLIAYYPEFKMIYCVDIQNGEEKFYNLEKNYNLEDFIINQEGRLIITDGSELKLFSAIEDVDNQNKTKLNTHSYSANERYNLAIIDKSLWLQDNQKDFALLIKDFEEEPEDAFWLNNSDSIPVALKTKIVIIDSDGENERLLSAKDSDSQVLFSSDLQKIFWQYQGIWHYYSF